MAAEVRCIIDNRDAIKAYKRVLQIAPNCITAHFNLAGCYAATHKRKLALQEYEFLKNNAPELVDDLESVLGKFGVIKQKRVKVNPNVTKQIEKVLTSSDEPVSPKVLFGMGIASNSEVLKALNALEEEGKMKRVKPGNYMWTGG